MTFCMSTDIYGPNIRVIAFSQAYEKAITTLNMIYDLAYPSNSLDIQFDKNWLYIDYI